MSNHRGQSPIQDNGENTVTTGANSNLPAMFNLGLTSLFLATKFDENIISQSYSGIPPSQSVSHTTLETVPRAVESTLTSPAGTTAGTHPSSDRKGSSYSRTAKKWVVSYTDKGRKNETLSTNEVAKKANRTGPGLQSHMKEATENRYRYVSLLFYEGDDEGKVQWTATHDLGDGRRG